MVGVSDYVRKRFEERIWDSPIGEFLRTLEEPEGDRLVNNLVEGLLTEIGF